MNDVLTEMKLAAANPTDNPELYATPAEVRAVQQAGEYVDIPDPRTAEMALLRHLALEGELCLRRDQLQAEHAAISQRLAQARQQRQGLVEAVQAAGGELPRWDMP